MTKEIIDLQRKDSADVIRNMRGCHAESAAVARLAPQLLFKHHTRPLNTGKSVYAAYAAGHTAGASVIESR